MKSASLTYHPHLFYSATCLVLISLFVVFMTLDTLFKRVENYG